MFVERVCTFPLNGENSGPSAAPTAADQSECCSSTGLKNHPEDVNGLVQVQSCVLLVWVSVAMLNMPQKEKKTSMHHIHRIRCRVKAREKV